MFSALLLACCLSPPLVTRPCTSAIHGHHFSSTNSALTKSEPPTWIWSLLKSRRQVSNESTSSETPYPSRGLGRDDDDLCAGQVVRPPIIRYGCQGYVLRYPPSSLSTISRWRAQVGSYKEESAPLIADRSTPRG